MRDAVLVVTSTGRDDLLRPTLVALAAAAGGEGSIVLVDDGADPHTAGVFAEVAGRAWPPGAFVVVGPDEEVPVPEAATVVVVEAGCVPAPDAIGRMVLAARAEGACVPYVAGAGWPTSVCDRLPQGLDPAGLQRALDRRDERRGVDVGGAPEAAPCVAVDAARWKETAAPPIPTVATVLDGLRAAGGPTARAGAVVALHGGGGGAPPRPSPPGLPAPPRSPGERLPRAPDSVRRTVDDRWGQLHRLGERARHAGRRAVPSRWRRVDESRSAADWQALADREPARTPVHGRQPEILYLLPALVHFGGVISVLQLANRLTLRGVRVRVATSGPVSARIFDEPMLVGPEVYRSRGALLRQAPPADIVVATYWNTVFEALELKERWGCRVVGFVQGADEDTFPPGSSEARGAALAMRLLDRKIVKTRWLADRMAPTGGEIHRIALGLDHDVFHPRPPVESAPRRVLAHASPGSHNLEGIMAILGELARRRDDVLPTLVGLPVRAGFRHEHVGRISQREVAELHREAAVLIDPSHFQAFGRPGLEAMACATPAVLTTEGGINEYAHDGSNCLQVTPEDVGGWVQAVERLLDDDELARGFVQAGLETADGYDCEREADATKALLESLA